VRRRPHKNTNTADPAARGPADRAYGPSRQLQRRPPPTETRQVLEACRGAALQKEVYLSSTMSLKTLHTGARGTWIYQASRITLLLTYAEAKGLDPHSPPKTPPKRREAKTPPNLDTRETPAARLPHRERRPPNPKTLPGGPGAEPPGGGPGHRLSAGGLPLKA